MQSNIRPRTDVPTSFNSLNDDVLTTVLEFVGPKSYRPIAGINKHWKEIYLSSGMTKKTFLFGHAPLSVFKVYIERVGYDRELCQRLGKGVVYYNRRDVFEWLLQEKKKYVLQQICRTAAGEGRIDILNKVWNDIEDWDEDKVDIFEGVENYATNRGQLNVLKWYDTKGFNICKEYCVQEAAYRGHLHILQWLWEEKGLQLTGQLYYKAVQGGQLCVMKWLREKELDWNDYTFVDAAEEGNLEVLQWLHYERCPWNNYCVYERDLKPEAVEWLRSNGYSDRLI